MKKASQKKFDPVRVIYGDLAQGGRFWFWLAVAVTLAGAVMLFEWGSQMSRAHGVGLGGLSIIAALLPDQAQQLFDRGKWLAAMVLGIISIGLLGAELQNHIGYTAGTYGTNIERAQVQNTSWKGAQDAVTEDQANSKSLQILLKTTRDDLAAMKKASPFATTVTAAGLRAQLPLLQKEIDDEAANGGCGPRCKQRMREKNDVEARLASIDRINQKEEDRDRLIRQLANTQKVIDRKRTEAKSTTYASSQVTHQRGMMAQAVSWLSGGSVVKASEEVEEGSGLMTVLIIALALTVLPAIGFYITGTYRIHGQVSHAGNPYAEPNPYAATAGFAPAENDRVVVVQQPATQDSAAIDAARAARTEIKEMRSRMKSALATRAHQRLEA